MRKFKLLLISVLFPCMCMGEGIFRFIFYLRLHLNKMEGIFFIRIFAVFFRV